LAVMRIAGLEERDSPVPDIWSVEKMETYRMENAKLFAAFVQTDPTELGTEPSRIVAPLLAGA